jgi:hypothetical protein
LNDVPQTRHIWRRLTPEVHERATVPAIEVIWTEIPDPHRPWGARHRGDRRYQRRRGPSKHGLQRAGKRNRELPITHDKVLSAC